MIADEELSEFSQDSFRHPEIAIHVSNEALNAFELLIIEEESYSQYGEDKFEEISQSSEGIQRKI